MPDSRRRREPAPQRRGPVVVFYQMGAGDDQRIALLVKKVTGVETAIDSARTIIYYARPGSRSVTVEHRFDDVIDALWPEEEED